MTIELPYPPSVNHYYRHVGPRVLISAAGRRYREVVGGVLLALGLRPRTGPLAMTIEFHPPDRRRRDLDNALKAFLDALQHGGAFEDDSQVRELHAFFRPPCRPAGKAIARIDSCS